MRLRPSALALTCCLALAFAPAAMAQDSARLAQEAGRLQAQGNLDQAVALLTEALGDTRLTNDRRAALLTDRGALLARLNQPKAAIEDFNRAVQLYPEYPAIYNNRGSTLLTLGLAREAIKDFDRAIVLAPGYVAAFNNRAGARMLLGQTELAIADFTRAVELSPGTVAALAGRGRALLAANRPEAAARDLSHALATDNRFALGYRLRAEARLAVDREAEAIEDLSRAAAFEPTNVEIYLQRGNAYLEVDNIAAALKDFARALELDPQSVPALEARAMTHARLDAQAEAEADIARALELSAGATGAMAARALLFLRTAQPELSRREIERALKLTPTQPEVMLVKAEIDAAAGRRDDAVKGFRAVLAARPGSKTAVTALVRLTGRDERHDVAELRGYGVDQWRVMRRGARHLAVSDEYPRISVPLETIGGVSPKLIEFEVMRPPYAHLAVLRFIAGSTSGPAGPEEVHNAAILDLPQGTVLSVLPEKRGQKTANWSWEENRLVISAADGLTDEFVLRGPGRATPVAAAQSRRQPGDGPRTYAPPAWLPFGFAPSQPQRRAQRQQQPKTIFDLLFGN